LVPSVNDLPEDEGVLALVLDEAGAEVGVLELFLLLPQAASSRATSSVNATVTVGADGLRLTDPLDMSSSFLVR
jgi:hypothetical protein